MTTLDLTRPTAPLVFTNPFTPIGYTTGGQPVYGVQGGRVSGGSINFDVRDDDGSADFDEDDDTDDDDDDEQDDEQDDAPRGRRRAANTEDDDSAEDDPEWEPPTRDSWERVQGALKRANAEAGKRRRVGKTMDKLGITDLATWLTERGIDPESGQPYGQDVVGTDDDDAEGDGYEEDGSYEREETARGRAESAREVARRDKENARRMLAAEQRGRAAEREALLPILAETTARQSLRDAGFTGTASQLDRVLRMVDPASIDVEFDDTGFELVGMDDAIEEIKADFPEFFEDRTARRRTTAATARTARSRPRGGAREVDGGGKGRQPQKTGDWRDKIMEQMQQRGRA